MEMADIDQNMKLFFERYEYETKQKGKDACKDFTMSEANYSRKKNSYSKDAEIMATILEKIGKDAFCNLLMSQYGKSK